MADDVALATQRPSGGHEPHRFTWDEVVRMAAADVFGEATRVELIGGELFTMPEEGFLHVDVVHVLQRWLFAQIASLGFDVFVREPVHMSDGSALIPDLCVFPGGTDARGMQAARALLIVEVSDSTLAFDRNVKSPRYVADSVPELWIVEARARAVNAHRAPLEGAWSKVDRVLPGKTVAPMIAPNAGFDPATLPSPQEEQ